GVLVRNEGAGVARNLTIESAQPEIIENEQGLLIDFEIIGAEINGAAAQPTLLADFGDVAANSGAVGLWKMQSDLQGRFVDYDATFTQTGILSGYPELSLIETVEIHELIHTVKDDRAGADDLPDFLVNDVADAEFMPDMLYTSDGTVEAVDLGTVTVIDGDPLDLDMVVQITGGNGWTYAFFDGSNLLDLQVASVQRSDGSFVDPNNIWQTDRVFPDHGRPTYEDRVHLLDYGSGSETYTFTFFDPTPNIAPIAVDDAFAIATEAALTGNLFDDNGFGADSDPEADPLSITEVNGFASYVGQSITLASGALLTVNGDGSFSYDPNGLTVALGAGESLVDMVEYTLSDGDLTDQATASFTVLGTNKAPTVTSPASVSVAENSTAVMTVNGTDPDGDPLSYAISGGADAGLFWIDPVTGDLSFAVSPDYENPADADGDNIYQLQLGISDGSLVTQQNLSVEVTNLTEILTTVSIGVDSLGDFEGDTGTRSVTFTVNRIGDLSNSVTIDLSQTGDADAQDLVANLPTQITLAAGQTSAEIVAEIIGDYAIEGHKTLELEILGTDRGDHILGTTIARHDIYDDDLPADAQNKDFFIGQNDWYSGNVFYYGAYGNDVPQGELSLLQINGADVAFDTPMTLASGALLTVSSNGLFTYDPNGKFSYLREEEPGYDSFTYTVESLTTLNGTPTQDSAQIGFYIYGYNDAPILSGPDAAFVIEGQTYVDQFAATDAEGDGLIYSLSGADAGLFQIDAETGELSFAQATDFTALTQNGDPERHLTRHVTVEVTDGRLVDSIDLDVTLLKDSDGDGVQDIGYNGLAGDNAVNHANADQRDTDGDGYGNIIDFDFNGNGLNDALDLNFFLATYNSRLGDANFQEDADANDNGAIDALDLNTFLSVYSLSLNGQSWSDLYQI
ncbi:MAG: Ig-like domain-containing protein, partial [Mangrovicoccus sp.]